MIFALLLVAADTAGATPAIEPAECQQPKLPPELLNVTQRAGLPDKSPIIGTTAVRRHSQQFTGRCAAHITDLAGSYFRFASGRVYGLAYYGQAMDLQIAFAAGRTIGGVAGTGEVPVCTAQSPRPFRGDTICITPRDGAFDIGVQEYSGLSELVSVRARPDRMFFLPNPDTRGGSLTLFYRNGGRPMAYSFGLN